MAPLEGILVADFTRVLAGPYSTMLLADLGAQVIKVERPGAGDDTRQWGPPWAADGQSTYFHAVNRNKSSVALDLADRDDLRLADAWRGTRTSSSATSGPGPWLGWGWTSRRSALRTRV